MDGGTSEHAVLCSLNFEGRPLVSSSLISYFLDGKELLCTPKLSSKFCVMTWV